MGQEREERKKVKRLGGNSVLFFFLSDFGKRDRIRRE